MNDFIVLRTFIKFCAGAAPDPPGEANMRYQWQMNVYEKSKIELIVMKTNKLTHKQYFFSVWFHRYSYQKLIKDWKIDIFHQQKYKKKH